MYISKLLIVLYLHVSVWSVAVLELYSLPYRNKSAGPKDPTYRS